ncbi:unnamed protein product [Lactuca saligna]|uniref:Uncharacterized protein n=1 Tax=Lactuca saligna TaxID=75948 RepID=A0AA36EHC9_LACSI|nr:unnamed protein product [Lactuca saligna]
MTASTHITSFADQSTSMIMLNIKLGQNLILDLDASCYNELLYPMIECLRYSPLVQALTMAYSLPLVHLSKAYSSVNYSQSEELIHFEILWRCSSNLVTTVTYQSGRSFERPFFHPSRMSCLLFNSRDFLKDARDSLLTVSVPQHLAKKLKPIFSILNHIEGVLESDARPKQGGKPKKTSSEEPKKTVGDSDENEIKPHLKAKGQKGNEAS